MASKVLSAVTGATNPTAVATNMLAQQAMSNQTAKQSKKLAKEQIKALEKQAKIASNKETEAYVKDRDFGGIVKQAFKESVTRPLPTLRDSISSPLDELEL